MNIGIVVVTYNRKEKLIKSLHSFDEQSFKPVYIAVINNASNDGTADILEKWKNIDNGVKKYVINNSVNEGSSGGFNAALSFANSLNAEWIMILDDDAYLNNNSLEVINNYLANNSTLDISAICCCVKNANGEIQLEHRRRIIIDKYYLDDVPVKIEEYYLPMFECDSLSFVGSTIKRSIISKAGLPNKGFFIWFDDTEYSIRLKKYGRIICLPDAIINHDDDKSNKDINWKTYYGLRNSLYTYKKYYFLQYLYLLYKTIKSIIKNRIKNSNYPINMYIDAIIDSFFGKLGFNSKYAPIKKDNGKSKE